MAEKPTVETVSDAAELTPGDMVRVTEEMDEFKEVEAVTTARRVWIDFANGSSTPVSDGSPDYGVLERIVD